MINKNTLSAFLYVAEIGSFQGAARRLGVSNASVSRYVLQAEEQAGFTLFHRSRNSSKLTRAGQEFLPIARQLARDLGHYDARVEHMRLTGGGSLKIGCGPLTTRTLILPVLDKVVQRFPDVRINVSVTAMSEPIELLESGAIDIFLGDLTHTPDVENIDLLMVARQPVVFVANAAHELHSGQARSLKDVFQYPFACPPLHKHWRASLIKALGSDAEAIEKVGNLPDFESDDYGLLTGLLRQKIYVIGGMAETFAEFISLGIAKEIPLKQPMMWNICMARKTENNSPIVDCFWTTLKDLNAAMLPGQ